MIVKSGSLTPSVIVAGASIAAPSSGALRTAPQDSSNSGDGISGVGFFPLQQSLTGIPIMREDFITYTDLMPAE